MRWLLRVGKSIELEFGFGSPAPIRSAAINGCNPSEAVSQSASTIDN